MKRAVSIFGLFFLSLSFISSPVFAANTAAPQQKEWTFAVYLNADNNLDPFGVEDQNEMAKVGSNDWLNVVTLIDREKGPASYNYITKGKIQKLKDLGELDMGDWHQLVTFAKWVKASYPANHYALVIWNHGSGWKKKDHAVTRGISYDDSSNNHITTAQLGQALGEIKTALGKNIDILGFDACLMQMAEVAFVCREKVDYIVGSEETEPGKGTPYDDALKTLTKTTPVEDFAKAWVKAYIASYNHGSQGYEACTQSLLKVSELDGVIDAMNGFAKAAIAGKFANEFTTALSQVQKFAEPENVDLIHLMNLLKVSVNDMALKTAIDKVLAACDKAILANGNIDDTMKNAMGLAVYFPPDSYAFDSTYTSLEFCQAGMWDEMIQDFFKKKTSATLVSSIEKGDMSVLRDFVSSDSTSNQDLIKFVIGDINFRLHSEAGLPANVTAEASNLIGELSRK
ncbi:MAG: hypothetical protein HQM09_01335 [Candidatus Riflebacteria bacterium]|nr:hypothetical protein [Candidatus Riflebacteria bacterium]